MYILASTLRLVSHILARKSGNNVELRKAAVQRLAFSRSFVETNAIDRERRVVAPIRKIAAARLSVATRCWAAAYRVGTA